MIRGGPQLKSIMHGLSDGASLPPLLSTSNRSRPRLKVSSTTVLLFFASFLTHDAGELIHSVVSLVFAAVLVLHIRNNWRVYVISFRRLRTRFNLKAVLDSGQLALAVVVIVSGVTLWIGGEAWELGHETTGGAITLVGIAHIFFHRESLMRLARRS